MHLEILNKNQLDLLPFLAKFKREYYMVGGTLLPSTSGIGYPLISIYLSGATLNLKSSYQNLTPQKRYL